MNNFIMTTNCSHMNRILLFIIILMICFTVYILHKSENETTTVYLINLERRPDRLKLFMDAYHESGIKKKKLIKFHAIDGNTIDLKTIPMTQLAILEMKQLDTIGFRYKHYQLTRGAIGCYLSHVKIWENIIDSGVKQALIFEDDANPPKDVYKDIKETMNNVPEDWDIVLFGKYCYDCQDKGKYIKVNRFILLHSYMISRKGILKIFNENNLFPISQQLDAHLSEISNIINIYSSKKNLVSQRESRTDIQAPMVTKSHNTFKIKKQDK